MAEVAQVVTGALVDGRYEIGTQIGRGAASRVFEALDRLTGARVALKLLAPPGRRVPGTRRLGELQRLQGLEHPCAARVLRGFAWEDGIGIAMELVDGPDLASQVEAHGPLDPARAVALALDLARALAAAHAQEILHGHVKPTNVLLDASGAARLADFGGAHVEGPYSSAAFVAPERIAGRSPDAAGDLYGLGMTLYFALTGSLPDGSMQTHATRLRPGGHHPRLLRPAIPAWLDAIVARCTRLQPGERFASAEALLSALEQRSCSAAPAADPDLLDVCVLCRQPGTFGRALCPHCEDPASAPEDTLVVLERASGPREHRERMQRLAALSDQHANSPLLTWAADGNLALVRVSERQARALARRLAAHGLAARCIPAETGWQILPRGIGWIAAGLLAAGIGAGATGNAPCLPVLMLLGGALPAAATALVQHVALLPRRAWPRPAALLVREVAGVMPELGTGDARHLLVDCLRLGRSLDQRLAGADAASAGPGRCALAELLIAACAAARELAQLDALLGAPAALEARHAWLPLGQSARADLVECLLGAIAALSQLRSQPLLDPATSASELAARAEDLREAQAFAARQAKEGLAEPGAK